jgi:hypothetical protein
MAHQVAIAQHGSANERTPLRNGNSGGTAAAGVG